MLTSGQRAPSFSLKDKDGKAHGLRAFTILFFYPKDDTPGCTIESKSFSDHLKEFERLGAQVMGISGGDDVSKQKFCARHDLHVVLLSDQDFSVSTRYGVYGERSFLGRKFMGIARTTFVIKDGLIVKVFEDVKPPVHVQEVIAYLKGQQ